MVLGLEMKFAVGLVLAMQSVRLLLQHLSFSITSGFHYHLLHFQQHLVAINLLFMLLLKLFGQYFSFIFVHLQCILWNVRKRLIFTSPEVNNIERVMNIFAVFIA